MKPYITLHETGPHRLDLEIREILGSSEYVGPFLQINQGGLGISLSKMDIKRLRRFMDQFLTGDL